MFASFDNTTGQVYNPFFLDPHDPDPREPYRKIYSYGIMFSPDNSKLYAAGMTDNTRITRLVQYNLEKYDPASIVSSMVSVGGPYEFSGTPFAIGPDGKIYTSTFREPHYLSVIHNPNLAGTACNYEHKAVFLGKGITDLSLPNFPSHLFHSPDIYNDTVCESGSVIFRHPGISDPVAWFWSFPGGSPSFFEGEIPPPVYYERAGSYKAALITGARCAIDTAAIWEVVVEGRPEVSVTGGTVLCAGDTTQIFVGGGVTYSWSPATGLSSADIPDPLVSPGETTLYTVTVGNSLGCLSTTAVLVEVEQIEGVVSSGVICSGDSVQLFAGGGTSYEWYPPDGLSSTTSATPRAWPSATTRYRVIVSNRVCSDTVWSTVEVRERPVASVRSDTTICAGETVQLFAGGGVRYEWFPATGLSRADISDPVATPLQTTRYTVRVTGDNGCSTDKSVLITVSDNIVLTVDEVVGVCAGETVQLSVTGADIYRWEPAALLDDPDSPSPVAFPKETTVFTITGTRGNCTGSTTVTVTVLPVPELSTAPDTSICIGGAAQLWVSGAETYQWFPSDGLNRTDIPNPIATPAGSTLYTVRGRSADGCEAEAIVQVDVRQKQRILLTIGELTAPPGDLFSIPVFAEIEGGGYADIPALDVEIRFNAASIELQSINVDGALIRRQGEEYIVALHLQDISINGRATLAEVRCRVLLSPRTETPLLCTGILPQQDCFIVESVDGMFRLGAYCGFPVYRGVRRYIATNPVPAQDELILQLHGMTEETAIQLFDIYGQLLHEQQVPANTAKVLLNTQIYGSGLYILKAICDGQIFTSMLTIAH